MSILNIENCTSEEMLISRIISLGQYCKYEALKKYYHFQLTDFTYKNYSIILNGIDNLTNLKRQFKATCLGIETII